MDFGPVNFEFFGQCKQWSSHIKNIESKKIVALKCFSEPIFELECHLPRDLHLQHFKQIKENTVTNQEELENCLFSTETSLSGSHFMTRLNSISSQIDL